jgi:NADH dehydrogenase
VTRTRIVVVGGGFAGVQCATALAKAVRREPIDVVLFNSENHLVFSPLLAEVVGSSINPLDVVVPLRQLLPEIHCRTEEGRRIDPATNSFEFLSDDGKPASMTYDHLVLACGNVTNLSVVPGMADHALPLKTVGDAAALRSHVMEQMEKAEVCPDLTRRHWYLTFLVVGGGFSGVEVAGEINDLVRSSARYFQNFKCEDATVILIHSRDQILPEISPGLRDFARRKMEKAGVKFTLNARVALATPEGVGLQSGEFLKGATIVCTVGNATAPIIERLPLPKEKGRLLTRPDMRLQGSNNIWAIGDCGMIVNEHDGQPSPTTGQFAERQGTQCALNILRVIKNQPTRPFRFKQLGELCSIGGHSAVADLFGMHLSGFFAWFVWRGVYLFKLPTWGRRLQVGFDWALLLLFPRDLAHIRTRQTDRVSHAHYQPGDVIIQPSDPPTNFYVIESGEVEVSRATDKDPAGEVVAVLGPGSFFGEKALLSDEPRVSTVRARTAVEVLVMGKNVFTQVSGALAPFKEALAKALNRRAVDVWKGHPEVHELLKQTPIKQIMEPVPKPILAPSATLSDVSHAFVETPNEIFYLASDGQTLEGVITLSDLLRARARGANELTPVKDFMSANPVALAAEDSCALAAAAIREYRLKSLPVVEKKESRKLVGSIRTRQLMAYVIKHTAADRKPATTGEPQPVLATTKS